MCSKCRSKGITIPEDKQSPDDSWHGLQKQFLPKCLSPQRGFSLVLPGIPDLGATSQGLVSCLWSLCAHLHSSREVIAMFLVAPSGIPGTSPPHHPVDPGDAVQKVT